MDLICFILYIAINVGSCMTSLQIYPKYTSQQPSDPDLTLPLDKNSFPDVVYPTSILDVGRPFYFNTNHNYEVLGPFSEDVKSSYKLLSSLTKPGYVISQSENNDIVTKPEKDEVMNLLFESNIPKYNNGSEGCVNTVTNETDNTYILSFEYQNVSLPQEEQNETCPEILLYVKVNVEVFKNNSDENKYSFQENEKTKTYLEQVTNTFSYESSEESSSSEEHTEPQNITHSHFIRTLSVLLLDLLNETDTTLHNERLKPNDLESAEILTRIFDSEASGLLELNTTDYTSNITFENILNLSEQFRNNDEEAVKDSKEDFLDLLVSLESACENYKNVETIKNSEYLGDYLRSENCTII